MQSLVTNTIPANWKTLFQERSEKIFCRITLFLEILTPWVQSGNPMRPLPHNCLRWREMLQSLPIPELPPQREGGPIPISLSEGGVPDTPVPVDATVSLPLSSPVPVLPTIPVSEDTPHSRWNSEHSHNTRFRHKVIKNFSPAEETLPF
jgi:hypothetical protein